MADDEQELQALRQKKMAQAQQQAEAGKQQEEQLRSALATMLEPAAYERLMLVKMSSPQTFAKAVQGLAYLQQAGQLKGRISDAQLRALLGKLSPPRPEARITIKRKGDENVGRSAEMSA
ncbi:DNA-binding protein [uncultured archaeon]|nr:DNA-binding protein [uncultured archaeon]